MRGIVANTQEEEEEEEEEAAGKHRQLWDQKKKNDFPKSVKYVGFAYFSFIFG